MGSEDGRLQSAFHKIEELALTIAKRESVIEQREVLLRNYHDELQIMRNENRRLRESNEQLTRERDNFARNLQDATDLSNRRGNELAGAQTFLSKADTISSAELQEKVAALNEEIFQTAAALGEGMVRRRFDVSESTRDERNRKVKGLVGEGMLKILQDHASSDMKDDQPIHPLLVQVAVQVFLTDASNYELGYWDPSDIPFSRRLRDVYIAIQAKEQQPVCGRWRSLTTAHLPPDFDGWKKAVEKNLHRIFSISNWAPRNHEQLEGFYRRLEPMFRSLQEVRTAIWRSVTSEDYRIFYVKPGESFLGDTMQESYGDESINKGDKDRQRVVLGTTSMGLSKAVIKSGFATHELQLVVAPEVVVESTFRAALLTEAKPRSLKRTRNIRPRQDGHG
ncbi:hypothetical protein CPB83DRAFT_862354 [Crepidotus variabilis]|uniref:Uncharacterized protein n=1 Tax=Crepidotus variabilis TaxID=179855 RepID=A0A9P6E710_9AGAR|nr:hypothetical protein CPB83DRAFT_862354 [Crepidotus variabilis]